MTGHGALLVRAPMVRPALHPPVLARRGLLGRDGMRALPGRLPLVHEYRQLPLLGEPRTGGRPAMTVERVGTVNVQGQLPDDVAAAALHTVCSVWDLGILNEWGPDRTTIARDVPGFGYRKPANVCPPLMFRDDYTLNRSQAIVLAHGRYVGVLPGRRSYLGDNVGGLYELTAPNGKSVALLGFHLPATVEKGRKYRRVLGALTRRARMHRQARRQARRLMVAVAKRVDRVYLAGDTNFHLMRFRTFVSCWANRSPRGTHGSRTIDIVYARQRATVVRTFDVGSDHRAVVASYVLGGAS